MMKLPLRLYWDQPLTRLLGTLIGLGFIAIGCYSLFGSHWHHDIIVQERAFGFGITAIIIGCIAVIASLMVKKLDNIWCRPPRRW